MKFKIREAVLAAVLVVFIAFLFHRSAGGTDKPLSEIAPPVLSVLGTEDMTEKTAVEAASVFGYDRETASETVYWENGSVMDVTELLIVKLSDASDGADMRSLIEKRVEEQKNLYRSYAPEQYALLEKCVIEVSGNVVFYCTADNAQQVYETFKKQL